MFDSNSPAKKYKKGTKQFSSAHHQKKNANMFDFSTPPQTKNLFE